MTSTATTPTQSPGRGRRGEPRRPDTPDTPDTDHVFRELAALAPGARRDGLREELIRAWLPLAHRLARRYRGRGEDLEDLEQVAALGLTKAIGRYDPVLGHAFLSYAMPVITGEIKRHFRDHTWDVHVPRRVQELRNQVRRALQEFGPGDSVYPPAAVLMEHLDLTEEEVRLGLSALESHSVLSLDVVSGTGGDDGPALGDTLGGSDPGYAHVVRREAVSAGLRRLPERERDILYLRFYREMSQSRIAAELGLSQMQVSRILARICARVRGEAETAEEDDRRVRFEGSELPAPEQPQEDRAGDGPVSPPVASDAERRPSDSTQGDGAPTGEGRSGGGPRRPPQPVRGGRAGPPPRNGPAVPPRAAPRRPTGPRHRTGSAAAPARYAGSGP